MKALLQRYAGSLLDLLYPRRCEVCDRSLEAKRQSAARWLCDTCLDHLPRIAPPFCQICGESYEGAGTDEFRCGNCADLKLHFDFAVAPYRAEESVRFMVHRFKYQHRIDLRGVLACLLMRTLEDRRLRELGKSEWTVVPVPLHHARERERQYNQAWELCREFSRMSGFPALNAMRRVRPTTSQASLSRNQRIENLRGAFTLRNAVAKSKALNGRNILLVDDVLTTGSTASECARVLRRDGAVEKVVVITVARG